MIRSALLALLALGLVAPAVAQTDDEAPMDAAETVAADTVDAPQLDPERARELYAEGAALLRERGYDDALLKFEEALVLNPGYAPAGLGLAQSLAGAGRYTDARSAAEEAIAMAAASDASNADTIQASAERLLGQVDGILAQLAEREAAAQQQAAANEGAQKVSEATAMLAANEIDFGTAADAFALLEQAKMGGYDVSALGFYYAKALIAMERAADAVPYAQSAVDMADPAADNSGLYILLAQAHIGAGNGAEANAALDAIEEGQAWHGWVAHYRGQIDS